MTENISAARVAVCERTDTQASDWSEFSGPETGVGVDRWFQHSDDGRQAYTCDDQGHVQVDIHSQDDDGADE